MSPTSKDNQLKGPTPPSPEPGLVSWIGSMNGQIQILGDIVSPADDTDDGKCCAIRIVRVALLQQIPQHRHFRCNPCMQRRIYVWSK